MDAVCLVQAGFAGDACEQVRMQRHALFIRDLPECRRIGLLHLTAPVSEGRQAGEEYVDAGVFEAFDDVREIGLHRAGIESAQHIVGAEGNNGAIRPVSERPGDAREAAAGGVAGDTAGQYHHVIPSRGERGFEARREGVLRVRKAETCEQRIPEGHDSDRPPARRLGGVYVQHGADERHAQ